VGFDIRREDQMLHMIAHRLYVLSMSIVVPRTIERKMILCVISSP
jgi:hypothetical protein